MISADLTPLHAPGSEPVTDTNFAARLVAARKTQSLTQQHLDNRSGAHVTQIRRYEAGTNQPTFDVFTPEEQEHVAAFIEGALLRHHARQAFSGQASRASLP